MYSDSNRIFIANRLYFCFSSLLVCYGPVWCITLAARSLFVYTLYIFASRRTVSYPFRVFVICAGFGRWRQLLPV